MFSKFELAREKSRRLNNSSHSQDASEGVGNCFIMGDFNGTIDFDPDTGIFDLTSNGSNAFVCKLDSQGNFLWAKSLVGTFIRANSIVMDASNNFYITGKFTGTVDFNPGSGIFNLTSNGYSDIFISKLDASGDFMWAKKIGGTASYNNGITIALDKSANVYTTGFFENTADFDPGSGTKILTANGFSDIFISKLDSSGNFIEAIAMGGFDDENGAGIFVDTLNTIYLTGSFQGTVDFDPGPVTYNLSFSGGSDIFVSKYAQSSVNVEANSELIHFNIFPNPGAENITINLNHNYQDVKIRLSSSMQQLVYSADLGSVQTINIGLKLASGIYFLSIFSNENLIGNQKLVKY